MPGGASGAERALLLRPAVCYRWSMIPNDLLEHIPPRYRVLNELGRGAKKLVVLAFDNTLERAVAIAAMHAEDEAGFDWMTEARAMAQLSAHPHVVTIYDVLEIVGKARLLITQYMSGGNLENLLEKGPVELPLAKRIARQILSALAHSHERKVIHRDLKPQNVLLDENGNVGLIDFGLAMWGQRNVGAGQMLGTIGFMAPEQIRGEVASPATDLYAFGCMLYELLAGRAPFEGENMFAVIRKHLSDEIEPISNWNPRVPVHLDALCRACLAKDPARRPASAEAAGRLLMSDDLSSVTSVSGSGALGLLPNAPPRFASFVGREQELEVLGQCLVNAASGVGSVVLIEGEPGLGKSALLNRVRESADGLGVTWLFARSLENLRVPNSVFLDALRPLDDELSPAEREALVVSSGSGVGTAGSESYHARVGDVVIGRALKRPLAIAIEDLHWLDESSLELFLHLAGRIGIERKTPIVLIGTVRASGLFQRRLARLRRDPKTRIVQLRAFNEDEVRTQITELLNQACSRNFAQAVYATTLGNPLFTARLIDYLRKRDALVTRGQVVTTMAPLASLGVSSSVYAILKQEIENLPEGVTHALECASVLEQEFDVRAVASLSTRPDLELVDALESALRLGFLLESAGRYTFQHPLLKQAVYENMSEGRRMILHWTAAQKLIEATSGPQLIECANHLVRAGREVAKEVAFGRVVAAARYSFDHFAWDQAARLAQAGLSLHEGVLSLPIADLHALAGHALHQNGEARAAIHHWRLAATYYRGEQMDTQLAEVLSTSLRARDNFRLADNLIEADQEELLAVADRLPPSEGDIAAEAFDTLAGVAINQGDLQRGRALSALAEELEISLLKRIRIANLRFMLALAEGDSRQAHKIATAGLISADSDISHPVVVRRLQRDVVAHYLVGDLPQAQQVCELIARKNVISTTGEQTIPLAVECAMATLRGDLARAVETGEQAIEVLCVSGYVWAAHYLIPAVASAHAHSGNFARARDIVILLEDPGRLFESGLRASRLCRELSTLIDTMSDAERGREYTVRPVDDQPVPCLTVSRYAAGMEALSFGCEMRALETVVDALSRARTLGMRFVLGWSSSVDRLLGEAPLRRGEPSAEAVDALLSLAEQLDREGVHFEAARARLSAGTACVATDPARARQMLARCVDEFGAMRAEYWRKRAERLRVA